VHNGGHREGRQGAGAFFSVIARPEVLARECHHQVNPASEKVVCERDVRAHQSQVEPGRDVEGGVSHVDDIARCGNWRMATAGGVVAKLMHPSIQRMCWLDGIGRGRAPHRASFDHFVGAAN
jgi:hypothetical protein